MGAAEQVDPAHLDAYRFLRALGERHTFQTFDDRKGSKRNALSRKLHGTLAEHADTLAQLNGQGAGVYVMVNAGDGKGRKAGNVRAVRALFADLDGAPLQPVLDGPLKPHIVVETSAGRWHAYWLADGIPLDQFKPLQQAIAQRFNSDPSICDLCRVARLPGYQHMKRAPFRSHIVTLCDGPRYSHADVVQAFPPITKPNPASAARECKGITPATVPTLADTVPEGKRNSTLFKLACGFVRKGIPTAGINDRLQRINAERCQPPLCASEVDTIASNASAQGSQGFAQLTHALMDSPEWKALPAASIAIVLAFFRHYNGSNNGRLAVPWRDFEGRHGIDTSRRFYRYLRRAVNAGILIQASKSRNGQNGRIPAFYAIADKWLAHVSKQHMAPSVKTAHLNR